MGIQSSSSLDPYETHSGIWGYMTNLRKDMSSFVGVVRRKGNRCTPSIAPLRHNQLNKFRSAQCNLQLPTPLPLHLVGLASTARLTIFSADAEARNPAKEGDKHKRGSSPSKGKEFTAPVCAKTNVTTMLVDDLGGLK